MWSPQVPKKPKNTSVTTKTVLALQEEFENKVTQKTTSWGAYRPLHQAVYHCQPNKISTQNANPTI
jgi:hypothetical protein